MFSKKKLIIKYNIILIYLVFFLLIILGTYYFGAYSFYHKLFPFNPSKKVEEKVSYLKTAYHDIEIKNYNMPNYSKYGGIDFLSDNLIYMEGNGDMYVFKKKLDDKFALKKIVTETVPNNRKEFIKKYEKEHGKVRLTNSFGIRDILIEKFKSKENYSLIISTLDYDIDKDCHRLSVLTNEFINIEEIKLKEWKRIFSSKECLNINLYKKKQFYLAGAGGRLVKFDDNNILLSTGNFGGDGYYSSLIFPQDLKNDYGKIIQINLDNLSSEIFSYGHRNPQGLFLLDKKNIFSTEHGPKGGDELNFILKGKNYGWPIATFGTDYFIKYSKTDITNNSHNGFEKPIYSWGDKLGISQLIVYKSNYFNKWKENIITTSLVGETLTRIIYDKDKKSIIYVENIPIGKRIRDIIEAPNGEIVLLTDQQGGYDGYNSVPEIIFLSKKPN